MWDYFFYLETYESWGFCWYSEESTGSPVCCKRHTGLFSTAVRGPDEAVAKCQFFRPVHICTFWQYSVLERVVSIQIAEEANNTQTKCSIGGNKLLPPPERSYFQFGLFVCQRNYGKDYTGPIFKKVEAWARAKEEPIQCWSRSKWLNTRYWKIWEKRYNCNIASSITVLYFSTCKFKFDSRKNGVLCCCRQGGAGVLHFVVNFNSVFLYFSTAAQCETKWIYMQVLAQSSMWSIHVWVHLKKCSTRSTSSIYCT